MVFPSPDPPTLFKKSDVLFKKFIMKCLQLIIILVCVMLCGCNKKAAVPQEIVPRGVLIDVRTPEERAETGYITGSVCIVHTQIHADIGKVAPDTRTPVGVYCRSGRRSAMAAEVLKKIGYTDVTDYGGFEEAQKKLSLPVVKVK